MEHNSSFPGLPYNCSLTHPMKWNNCIFPQYYQLNCLRKRPGDNISMINVLLMYVNVHWMSLIATFSFLESFVTLLLLNTFLVLAHRCSTKIFTFQSWVLFQQVCQHKINLILFSKQISIFIKKLLLWISASIQFLNQYLLCIFIFQALSQWKECSTETHVHSLACGTYIWTRLGSQLHLRKIQDRSVLTMWSVF